MPFENPFLRGYFGAQQANEANTANNINALNGLLALQTNMEMKPLQAMLLRAQVDAANRKSALLQSAYGALGGAPAAPTGAPMAFGEGGVSLPGGAQGNMQTGQVVPQAAPAQQQGDAVDRQILALTLSGDPGAMAYAKILSQQQIEQRKPVVNRGFGIGTMQNGKYVPDQASLDQALALERGKQGIELPYRNPVSLPTSSGQTASVFPSEFPTIQGGQLPPRLQPPGHPQNAPRAGMLSAQEINSLPSQNMSSADAEANRRRLDSQEINRNGPVPIQNVVPGTQAGIGQIGITQSNADKITQERQTTGGKAIDEAFAKDYVPFINGGAQDAAKQLSQLGEVRDALKAPGANLTGPFLGKLPDSVKSFTNPQAISMRERVEEVVQRSLRAVLGAQFTEKEGERLIARAYNPNLSEAENAIRVNRLYEQLNQAYENKKAAAQYFSKNGTLEGWQGKLPSIVDFDPEAKAATPQRRSTDAPQRTVSRTGTYQGKQVVQYSDGTIEYK